MTVGGGEAALNESRWRFNQEPIFLHYESIYRRCESTFYDESCKCFSQEPKYLLYGSIYGQCVTSFDGVYPLQVHLPVREENYSLFSILIPLGRIIFSGPLWSSYLSLFLSYIWSREKYIIL